MNTLIVTLPGEPADAGALYDPCPKRRQPKLPLVDAVDPNCAMRRFDEPQEKVD